MQGILFQEEHEIKKTCEWIRWSIDFIWIVPAQGPHWGLSWHFCLVKILASELNCSLLLGSWVDLVWFFSQLIKWKVLGRCQIHNYVFAIKVIFSFFFCHLYFSFENVLFKGLFQGFYCLKNLCTIPLREYCNIFCLLRKQKRLSIDWIRVSFWMKL